MNRYSKTLVIFAALVIWYALIGFWIAPALIRHFGEQQLQARFSPDSSIAQVRINPFAGSFRVEGLKLADLAGAWSVEWQAAELNISAASLFKFYPVVDALRLAGADIRFEKRPSQAVEVSKVSEPSAGGDWRDLVKDLNLTEIPQMRVDLLEVSEGRIEFVDQTAATTYKKVMDPIDFTLRDFTTVVEGDTSMRFIADMDDGAVLRWEGDLKSQPIRSSGSLSLNGLVVNDLSPYYNPYIRFHLKRAVFGLGFDYQLDLSDLENLFQIENGQMSLTEVLCEPIEQDDQLISVDSVSLEGIGFRFPDMALEVASLAVTNGATRIFRDADGQINLAQLLVLPAASGEPAAEVATSESSLPEFSYRIEKVRLTDYRIVWEEALTAGLANLTVEIPNLELSAVSSDLDAPIQFSANYQIGDSGTAQIDGRIVPAEPVLDLSMQIEGVPLHLLSPYAQSFGETEIESGTFSFDGRFQYAATGEQLLVGDASVRGLTFVYADNLKAKWVGLDVGGLRMDLAPFSLALESAVLDQPEVVWTKAVSEVSEEMVEEADVVADVVETPNVSGSSPMPPIRVDLLSISQGRVTFVDESMQAVSQIEIDSLGLILRDLDLAGSQPAKLDLNAHINGSAFELHGALNTSQLKESTQLKASLTGLSLPAFSSYSGQAVGRRIANGTFNLESDWTIEASQLKASNQIRIEQLEFGDKVDSEHAVSLPLDLAVTLLTGPNGVMDLSLPLSGDLNDPKVGIGQIVRTAIVGLITNVATSPFKLLSGLVGAEEDLSVVNFDAGSAALSPAMITRINTLASALKERPGLKLAITPQISTADEVQLAEDQLRVDLLGEVDLSDEQLYRKRLAQRYREAMEAAGTPDEVTQVDDALGLKKMVTALLPGIQLADAERVSLAAVRARAIREHLITAQGIDPERLSLAEAEVGASEPGARFDLK
ncbi:DUF748 domain-containing protein [Coraliomargarita algicola]|uniref:DUF748 domain-containing protein n=1 Tax=Coraliomargarita algicola TaxID=3092156 RepID=A0ABZ0RWW6_9BACT|nr:DUF748 domain-containing protein [Coraliomargarita sp. J2-16]WPJ97504.1 DUF748 domain-containing protein [Coraliomargarita sp. J2-16]